MTTSPILGRLGKAYANTGADWNTPTWTEVDNIRDLSQKLTPEDADVTTRGSGGYRQTMQSFKAIEITFQCVWDPADAQIVALWDAAKGGTTVDWQFLDGSATPAAGKTSRGFRAEWSVEIQRNEALADAMLLDVTLKPGAGHAPEAVEIVGV